MKKIFIIILLALIIPLGIVYANGGDEDHHGMMDGWGMMGVGWGWFGWIFMVLLLIVLILVIVVLIKWLISQDKK